MYVLLPSCHLWYQTRTETNKADCFHDPVRDDQLYQHPGVWQEKPHVSVFPHAGEICQELCVSLTASQRKRCTRRRWRLCGSASGSDGLAAAPHLKQRTSKSNCSGEVRNKLNRGSGTAQWWKPTYGEWESMAVSWFHFSICFCSKHYGISMENMFATPFWLILYCQQC